MQRCLKSGFNVAGIRKSCWCSRLRLQSLHGTKSRRTGPTVTLDFLFLLSICLCGLVCFSFSLFPFGYDCNPIYLCYLRKCCTGSTLVNRCHWSGESLPPLRTFLFQIASIPHSVSSPCQWIDLRDHMLTWLRLHLESHRLKPCGRN